MTQEDIKTLWVKSKWVDALQGVNLEVCSGEVVALLGLSGSGKSVLLNIIDLTEGYVWLDSEPV